jgi:hypothetical protein
MSITSRAFGVVGNILCWLFCCRGDLGDTVWGTLIKDRSPSNGKYVRQRLLLGHFLNLLVAGEWASTARAAIAAIEGVLIVEQLARLCSVMDQSNTHPFCCTCLKPTCTITQPQPRNLEHMVHNTVKHNPSRCCAVLCCAVLCCAVLCCAVLCCPPLPRP